ncbi:hypothetical protein CLOLEP_01298 [[Clostridium] leptum DSM 753]|uniref:Uncharacterized protein n=1 Tax=[Clostridium] leptum DSM 753 TaxID=428125 RepID=A7VRW1_9FIRM|nr:hypothetical protein CLOLEP_01298 [[Clostridium] leptum DSM 753]
MLMTKKSRLEFTSFYGVFSVGLDKTQSLLFSLPIQSIK